MEAYVIIHPMSNLAEGIKWDLSDLYASPQDPSIEADLKKADARAIAFEKKYKKALERVLARKSKTLDVAGLLKEYKALATVMTRPMVYAHLYFAEKTDA